MARGDPSTGPHAENALRHVFPEEALTDLLDAEDLDRGSRSSSHAVRQFLDASRGAYAAGRRRLEVPAVLAGGTVPFDAPAGVVRQELVSRLDRLVRSKRIQPRDATAVVARFGLDGQVGGAQAARAATGLRRQATSDAVNRAIAVVAADISAQPLMPLEGPSLTAARRQLIVGAVLSSMHGPSDEYPTRLYAHMRVRAELLGHPVFAVGPADSTERQRRRRLANRWLAIASDHLDRDTLPIDRPLPPSAADQAALEVWRKRGDPMVPLSVGAMRALVAGGVEDAFENPRYVQAMMAYLLDGYRPLVELLAVAHFVYSTPGTAELWTAMDRPKAEMLRASAPLVISDLLANRGYPDAAALYAGIGQDSVTDATQGAWLRFRRLIVMEGVSYLGGAPSVERTRQWQQTLVAHLDRFEASGDPMAVAYAIVRAEHAAWTAGVTSGATVDELLEPLEEPLEKALRRAPAENRARFDLVRTRLAELIGGSAGPGVGKERSETGERGDAADGERFDEWYCAHPIAIARWDARTYPRGADEWRR